MSRHNKSSISPTLIFVLIIAGICLFALKNHYKIIKVDNAGSVNQISFNKEEIENSVKSVIKDNPELIFQTLESYQIKKMRDTEEKNQQLSQQRIKENKNELQDTETSPYIGNVNADVTIIEFFDYACGYCKKASKTIEQLIADDKKLKVIFKEFPILGDNSRIAARAALAVHAIEPSKYVGFHNALMKTQPFNDVNHIIEILAKQFNIDLNKLKAAMGSNKIDEELNKVRKLAEQLNIHGTPVFIIGDEIIPGALELDQLKQKINNITRPK